MIGWPEIVGILIIVLVLFGARKVPELMRGLGQGIKEFKKASREMQDEIEQAVYAPPPAPRRTTAPADSVATERPVETSLKD